MYANVQLFPCYLLLKLNQASKILCETYLLDTKKALYRWGVCQQLFSTPFMNNILFRPFHRLFCWKLIMFHESVFFE